MNTTFWFVPLEIVRNKEKVVRSRFPGGNFPMEICVPFNLQISRLYHQFHTFRGLLSGQAFLGSLEWNL